MSNPNTKTHTTFSKLLNYPWHFALLSIVFMSRGYFLNKNLFAADVVALYTAISVLVSIIIFIIFKQLLSLYKAGLLMALCVLLFFNYGITYDGFDKLYIFSEGSIRPILEWIVVYLPYIFGFLALITLILFKLQKREYSIFVTSTTLLNIIALTLVGGIVVREINIALTIDSNPQSTASMEDTLPEVVTPEIISETLPDIYYIILDAYSRNDHLASHWGIDNTSFTSQLETLGFYIADESVSNYSYTQASLSSSLNLDYLENFAPPQSSRFGLSPFIVDNRAAKNFQAIGYEYIVITSGFLPYSTIADMTIDVTQSGDLLYTAYGDELPDLRRGYLDYLYLTSLLRIFDPTLSSRPGAVAHWQNPIRTNSQFLALQQIAENDTPTFTFFHLTKSHPPITLDRQGNFFYWIDFYPTQHTYLLNEAVHFEDQLMYLNERVLETVDYILQESTQPPLIIIQADHGFQSNHNRPDFANSPIAILNAYYFPDNDYSNLREDITPVNSFRILFNQYFGFDYELLSEASYYQPSASFNAESGAIEFEIIPDGQLEPPYRPEN